MPKPNQPTKFIRTVKYFQVLLCIISINQSFIYTQLNDQTLLYNTSHLFSHRSNVKQFYLPHSAATLDQSGPGSNCNEGLIHIPQSSRTVTSSLIFFSVISRTLNVGWVLPFCIDAVSLFYSPWRVG